MKKFVEKIFGIDKIKAEAEANIKAAEESRRIAEEAALAAERAKAAEEEAKLTPK